MTKGVNEPCVLLWRIKVREPRVTKGVNEPYVLAQENCSSGVRMIKGMEELRVMPWKSEAWETHVQKE